MKLIEQSCFEFTGRLAAKEPVPGGGGAAALIGALSAALCAMAANYTVGKAAYAAYDAEMQQAIETSESLRMQLLALIDADAEAFQPLAEAYKLPKDDPQSAAKLQEATLNACLAPMGILQCCVSLLGILETVRAHGSKLMQSDVGCAASACAAAMECAAMNVLVNTRTLPDGKVVEKQIQASLKAHLPRARKIANDVLAELRK